MTKGIISKQWRWPWSKKWCEAKALICRCAVDEYGDVWLSIGDDTTTRYSCADIEALAKEASLDRAREFLRQITGSPDYIDDG